MIGIGMRQQQLCSSTILIILLLLFSIVPLSFAEDVEFYTTGAAVSKFYALSPGTYTDVCAYELHTESVTLRNQGTLRDTYYITIEADGPVVDWISVAEQSVMLDAGEEKTVYVYVRSPADVTAEFDYNIQITSTYDATEIIEKSVTVKECTNMELAAFNTVDETCPCSTGVYMFELVNTGTFAETYTLWLDGIDRNSYALSEEVMTLSAGERRDVYAYARLPCYEYGLFEFTLRAVTATTEYEAQLPLALDITQACYAYNVALGNALLFDDTTRIDVVFQESITREYVLCQETPAVIPVYMENPGDILNEYAITIQDGAAWISPSEPYVRLPGMTDYVTSLILNPSTANPGVYSFALKVNTQRGNVQAVLPFTVEIQDCDGITALPDWLEWTLYGVLAALVIAILAVGAMLTQQRLTGDEKKSATPVKKISKKSAVAAWIKKHRSWLFPLLILFCIVLLLGAFAYPIVKQKYQERLDTEQEESEQEMTTVPTLLYTWTTALVLLGLLLLLALLVWWFALCNTQARKKHKDTCKKYCGKAWNSVKRFFSKLLNKDVWKKCKPALKWIWIVLLILLLLSGLVFGLWFLYTNYKDDAGKLFAQEQTEERDEIDEEAAAELAALQEKLASLQEQIDAKEDEIAALEDELLKLIEEGVQADSLEEVNALQESIDLLQEDISTLEKELAELYDERDALLDTISDTETKINALEGQVTNLETEIASLNEQIAALQELIAQLSVEQADQEVIEQIEQEITELEEDVEELEEEKEDTEAVLDDVISVVDEEIILEITEDNFKTVLVFDVSLSGQIVEDGMSRFDRGIQEAEKFIQNQGEYTIMVVGKNALVIRRDVSADIAIRVLKSLRPLDTQSNLGKALQEAAEDIGDDDGRIVLVSDLITTDGVDLFALRDAIQEETGLEIIFLNVAAEEIAEEEFIEEEISEEIPQGNETTETQEDETQSQPLIEEEQASGPIFDVESQTSGSFFIEIPKNTPYSIDLSSYFVDPDNDPLTYDADVADHLTAVIDENTVTLLPETDWVGQSTVQFTADDNKGGRVQSPVIRVDVVEQPDVDYLPWIILGSILFLIVASLVFGAFAKRFQKDPQIPPKEE